MALPEGAAALVDGNSEFELEIGLDGVKVEVGRPVVAPLIALEERCIVDARLP